MSRKSKKSKSSSGGSGSKSAAKPSRVSRWWSSLSEDRRAGIKRNLGWGVAVMLFAVAGVFGLKALERRVLNGRTVPAPGEVRVALTARPDWMPARVADSVREWLTPGDARYYDEKLTARVYALGEVNPWIRRMVRVRKRRGDDPRVGVVDVTAEFRRPVARVLYDGQAYFVDAEGVRVPSTQTPRWAVMARRRSGAPPEQVCFVDVDDVPYALDPHPIHYVTIDGVAESPPPVGHAWSGGDVRAGLQLVKMVVERPYANQITVVDVRNHDGRISTTEPHLRMYAQVGRGPRTDIRFGRFPADSGDYVVSPQRKMSYLDVYAAEHDGRLAGLNDYIDLRYDELHVSVN